MVTKLTNYLSFLLLFFYPPSATAGFTFTYYVAGDTGLDSNDGLSEEFPFKTIQKAADVANSGDTINVKGGISYNETITPAGSGAPNSYITFQPWSGTGIPVIDITGLTFGFNINQDYIQVNGFEIKGTGTGATSYAIAIGLANNNILIRNNLINNISGLTSGIGVYDNAGTNIKIYNNVFYGNSIAVQIDGVSGTSYADIYNNNFW